MRSLKSYKKQQGFTIVELLIVIVVIGILAALVITTFTGVQGRARDTERETDIKAIHGQLEAYYADHGGYPSLTDINSGTWRDANMTGLDDEALEDPDSGGVQTLQAAQTVNRYAYVALPASCATDACLSYTLIAVEEDGTTTISKTSLN